MSLQSNAAVRLLGLLVCWSGLGAAHAVPKAGQVIPIGPFSPQFYGTLTLTGQGDEVFSSGVIRIYSSKTRQKIIEVSANELSYNLQNGKIKTNVKELPYGEQSLLMYEDFNFDGRKDLAIMDGQNSCYHGPSFQIFLAAGNTFKRNPELTRLAQDYCGMFDVDHQNKRLNVMTKDGCCWHQFESYSLLKDKPVLERREEIGGDNSGLLDDYYTYDMVTERRNGRYVKSEGYTFDPPAYDEVQYQTILSFPLASNSKRMVYVMYNKDTALIDYLLVNDGQVELGYQIQNLPYKRKNPDRVDVDFTYDQKNSALLLYPNDTKVSYKIIDTPQRLGIEVMQNGKVTFTAGKKAKKKGNLSLLSVLAVKNLARVK